MREKRKGFSLIELLVVIGIIAIMSAVMFPVFTNAKAAAKRGQCASNLRQISGAFEAYLADYSGYYPNTNNQYLWSGYYWREPISRYVGIGKAGSEYSNRNMVLACPADPTPSGIYAATSYAYSACFYMTPEQVNAVESSDHIRAKFASANPKLPCTSISSSLVKHASKKVLVTEYWTLHSENNKAGWYDDLSVGNDPWSGERNYLFADGHVKYLKTKSIHPSDSPAVSRPRLLPDINLTKNGAAGRDID